MTCAEASALHDVASAVGVVALVRLRERFAEDWLVELPAPRLWEVQAQSAAIRYASDLAEAA